MDQDYGVNSPHGGAFETSFGSQRANQVVGLLKFERLSSYHLHKIVPQTCSKNARS